MPKHCSNLDCPALLREGIPAEYIDTLAECAECGSPLTEGERPAPAPATFRELVTVYSASDPINAQLIRSALEAEGISATVAGAQLAGAVGELPATVLQLEIQVAPADAERAREVAVEIGG